MITGYRAEELFKNALIKMGCKVIEATRDENMFGHFDFVVNGQKIEVKSEKAINRGEQSSPIFWIEALNVRGDIGWLYGKSDKIAFLHRKEFWIVITENIRRYIELNIPRFDKPNKYKKYKGWYRRYGRMDSVTYIYPKDILPLVAQKIKIVSN